MDIFALLLILEEIFVTTNYNASYFGGWGDIDALYLVDKVLFYS